MTREGAEAVRADLKPSGPPVGESLAKMIKAFEDQREEKLTAHVSS
jgi:hypothetical protein